MRAASNDLAGLFESFMAGAEERVADLFVGLPSIDMPETGRSRDAKTLARCVEAYRDLLNTRDAKITVVGRIDTDARSVAELSVKLEGVQLPMTVALVGDRAGDRFSEVRGYHAMQHYKGYFTPRPRLLDIPVVQPAQPEVVEDYFRAIDQEPDPERVMSLYAEDACMVAPPGFRIEGRRPLRKIYELFLSSGAIVLHHCTSTDDGRSCAVEWACERWGKKVYPELQAGCSVYDYERDELRASRIYDDLEPPFST